MRSDKTMSLLQILLFGTSLWLSWTFPTDLVLAARAPVMEEYHGGLGESQESIKQKNEELKARQGYKELVEIPLVLPQSQENEVPPASFPADQLPSTDSQELLPANQVEPTRPLVIP